MSNIKKYVTSLKKLTGNVIGKMDPDQAKLIQEIVRVIERLESEISDLTACYEELNDYVESMDDDLAELESVLLDEDNDETEDDEDFEDNENDDIDDDDIIYSCPHCGHDITFSIADADIDDTSPCPSCGQLLFPETDDPDQGNL
jgi:rubrerythrin